jgi:hypothetical protein
MEMSMMTVRSFAVVGLDVVPVEVQIAVKRSKMVKAGSG